MIIVGAGSAGRETLEIILADGSFSHIVFFDNNQNCDKYVFDKYKIIKTTANLKTEIANDPDFCIAIGNPRKRKKMYNLLIELGGQARNAIYPDKVHSISTLYENGLIIQPGVNISYDVKIGKSCMIHGNSSIGHKVKIGDFINIGPLCVIIGPCIINDETYIGSGSIIHPHITIGHNVFINPGSVVTKNLNDYETY